MREDEFAFRVRWISGEIRGIMEVIQTHGREGGDDDVVVGEICVEGTAEREVFVIVCYGVVHAAVGFRDVLIC